MITEISVSTQKRTLRSLHPPKSKQDGGERLAFSLLNDHTPVLAAVHSGTWLGAEKCTLWADVQPDKVYEDSLIDGVRFSIFYLFEIYISTILFGLLAFIRAVRKSDGEIVSHETERERFPFGK